ncbi:MAG: Gfo/Idh/MocA family oxidoreductase [Candidatus Bathyarchaeia archaeon]
MADKYRVAIIGCGGIANAHARGYKALENKVEIVAIADPVPEALKEFGERYGIERRYSDAREMLDKEKPDIVSVCTWHKLHAPMTIAACARKPKAVLCEKPMATNMMECDEMMIAAQRNNVKLAIGHQRRFNASFNEAKRLIAEGAIGKPRLVFCSGTNQGLLNDATHSIDFIRYILGDPRALWVMGNIQRKTDRHERSIRIEECAEAVIYFENGTVAILIQELLWPSTLKGMGAIFLGSDGVMECDETMIRLLNSKSSGWQILEPKGEDPFIAQARELIDWIEGRVEHRGKAENGRAAVEIVMAIYESARMHECVRLQSIGSPLDPSCRLVHTRLSPLDLMIDSGHLPIERPGRYDVRAFLLRGEEMIG